MKISCADRINKVEEYYFSKKIAEISKMKQSGIPVINLGIGSPDIAPSSQVINELIKSSCFIDNHSYQSYIGTPELRNAFSWWYNKYFNVNLNPENEILPLIGSKEGIMHISMAFLNIGDEVLIPNPGYPAYAAVSKLLEAKIINYNLTEKNNWLPDITEIEKNDLNNVKIMWVNYPNMPTGAKASKKLFSELVEFGLKHNILICNDNPYSFILNDNHLSILSVKNAKEIALELNSLSKSHNMAGWRIGMVAGNKTYIKNILQVQSNINSGMFLPVQLAAVVALKSSENWYKEINEIYCKRLKIVWKILDNLGCDYSKDQAGMFVWAKIPDRFSNAEQFSELLLNTYHVFITPGSVFGSNGTRNVRISLCCDEDTLNEASESTATKNLCRQ